MLCSQLKREDCKCCCCCCPEFKEDDYKQNDFLFCYCYQGQKKQKWFHSFLVNKTQEALIPYMTQYFFLQLLVIGFEKAYNERESSDIFDDNLNSLKVFIITFCIFFYITITFSFFHREKTKEGIDEENTEEKKEEEKKVVGKTENQKKNDEDKSNGSDIDEEPKKEEPKPKKKDKEKQKPKEKEKEKKKGDQSESESEEEYESESDKKPKKNNKKNKNKKKESSSSESSSSESSSSESESESSHERQKRKKKKKLRSLKDIKKDFIYLVNELFEKLEEMEIEKKQKKK